MTRGPWTLILAVAIAVACAGCAAAPPPLATGPAIPAAGRSVVYAALGASETAGAGLNDLSLRSRYAWPQLFFNAALPRAATYYNLAVPGITTLDALRDEVPAALAVHPAVVTVFFNIDDLINGVSPTDFETHLKSIVHAMRQGGRARVLVGNAPTIDHLPAFMACEGLSFEGVKCPLPAGVSIPSQATVDATVNAYDVAIAEVVRSEGAVLVDVRARSDELATHPEYLAPDGLHPSPLGDQLLAELFAVAYRSAGGL